MRACETGTLMLVVIRAVSVGGWVDCGVSDIDVVGVEGEPVGKRSAWMENIRVCCGLPNTISRVEGCVQSFSYGMVNRREKNPSWFVMTLVVWIGSDVEVSLVTSPEVEGDSCA